MATDYKAINTYPQGTPSGTDRLPYFDAGGTIRYTQYSAFQENTPPPTEWRNIGLDSLRIPFAKTTSDAITLFYDIASNANAHVNDFLGVAIPEHNRIVMPIMNVSVNWGATNRRYSAMTADTLITNLVSGKDNCNTYYNASAANRGNDTAIGFAHNYSRVVNGYGIGAGEWWVPSPAECMQILLPYYWRLNYIFKILFGAEHNFYIWTSEDCGEDHAYRFYGYSGNVGIVAKNAPTIGLILMTEMKQRRIAAS